MHVACKNIKTPLPDLTVNGKNLEQAETFKYLGVTFHENLSWKPHMNNLRSKLRASIQQLFQGLATC